MCVDYTEGGKDKKKVARWQHLVPDQAKVLICFNTSLTLQLVRVT